VTIFELDTPCKNLKTKHCSFSGLYFYSTIPRTKFFFRSQFSQFFWHAEIRKISRKIKSPENIMFAAKLVHVTIQIGKQSASFLIMY